MSLDLVFRDTSYADRGAVYDVYREIGCRFLEPVYQECLSKEFTLRNISYVEKLPLELMYKCETLNQTYSPDFICYDKIIVELKALRDIADQRKAQLFNYLKATRLKLALLVNFGAFPKATIQQIIL